VIGYLDTSALIPLLVAEPGSTACRRFWDSADTLATSRPSYVEAAAALAQAVRLNRLTVREHRRCLRMLTDRWAELAVIEVDQELVQAGAELAQRYALRGYDAMHCAAALQLADPELVAATGDRALLAAWSAAGVATYDVNQP
jgi:predicted nucleic acid-binding protein